MAQRYGRNQRRAHRDQIAALEASRAALIRSEREMARQLGEATYALAVALGCELRLDMAALRPADGQEILYIDHGSVLEFSDETSSERGGQIKRKARVTLSSLLMTAEMHARLRDRYNRSAVVSYRGVGWQIRDIEVPRPTSYIDSTKITLVLVACLGGQ